VTTQWHDGTALGCIGRCQDCGYAIQLRRVQESNPHPHEEDWWMHFGYANHPAELMPGVGAYYDDLIAQRLSESE
jgi:hypothetical protein